MTNPKHFPPRLVVLIGPNRSIWRSSKGFEVVTTVFDLKELLVCFPLAQGLQTPSNFPLTFGRPSTRLFFCNFLMPSKLQCPSRLCHNSVDLSLLAARQMFCSLSSSRLSTYKFFSLFASKMTAPSFTMLHFDSWNLIWWPLSHSWLMLMRLCFNPLTNNTSSMIVFHLSNYKCLYHELVFWVNICALFLCCTFSNLINLFLYCLISIFSDWTEELLFL